jgi:hypothetical protein
MHCWIGGSSMDRLSCGGHAGCHRRLRYSFATAATSRAAFAGATMGPRTDLHAEGRYDIITDCDLRWWVSRVHNKCNVIQICSLTDVSG